MVDNNGSRLTRRQLLGISAAVTLGGVLATDAPRGAPSADAAVFGRKGAALDGFRSPAAGTSPRFRWWWPNGEVDPKEIVREVDEVADAGFGGLEIADVHHSVPGNLLDVEGAGWGGSRWLEAVEAALERAEKRGLTLDMTLGPSWPAAVPSITPQSEGAMTELAHGVRKLSAGERFVGKVPDPVVAPADSVTDRELLAVQAARVAETPDRGPIVLERGSLVDLTGEVRRGRIDWTAPQSGDTWVLLSYWVRGSGQKPEGGPHTSPDSFVVDHFGPSGASAVIDYWEAHILTARVKALLGRAGATFFEDSLEIETDATIWTPKILDEFSTRKGYDLLPFLPILVEQKEDYVYDFDDIKNDRVRDDFNIVLSDLYSEHHLLPFRDWAHRTGLKYRVQVYGLEQDSIAQAGIVDVPETESLGAKNMDDYRVLASGRDIAGREILSCEAAAYFGEAYNTTWNRVLQTLGEAYSGGVNQAVLHGFAYATAPGSEWPGFAAFSPYYDDAIGYSEAWGPRTPNWEHAGDVSAFIARTQWFLRAGRARYDLAILRQKGWAQTGIGAPWVTRSGIPVGWTLGFLDGSSLQLETSVVRNRRLAPGHGDYRAVIVDIDRFRGREATLSVDTAKKLVDHASVGLPIVLLGDWSAPESTGWKDAATNRQVASLVEKLTAMPSVAMAPEDDDIPGALARLGVTREVAHESSNLKHVHRVDGAIDYYYLSNSRHNPPKDELVLIEQEVRLAAQSRDSVPYALDAWTGDVRRLALYRRRGDQISIPIRLTPGQAALIVLAEPGWAGTSHQSGSVEKTDGEGARYGSGGGVEIVTNAAGTFHASLSHGRVKTVDVAPLPVKIELTSWDLSIDDWRPATREGTRTEHVHHSRHLDGLVPWNQIDGLEDVSGIGTYSTVVTLGPSWHVGRVGVYLDLGDVIDTFRIWINSRRVDDRDLLDTRVDISRYVRRGRNTVRVEVTSTLLNRLRVFRPEVYGVAKSQAYGLLGPVSVRPYGVARVL